MSNLLNYEWQYLLQTVSRIYCASTYQDAMKIFADQIIVLIPYDKNIFFTASKKSGKTKLDSIFSTSYTQSDRFVRSFLNGNYPHWSEFVLMPKSSIFRQSDLIGKDKWERSHVYNEIWKPQNIYYGLFMSVIYQDNPLVLFGLFRSKDSSDFSDRDVFILEMLKDCMEHKLYQLSLYSRSINRAAIIDNIEKLSSDYAFTKRELEIVELVCNGLSSERITKELLISNSTLNKHLSNIYAKTKVKSRVQLMNLFIK